MDEREEIMREACCIGDFEAVTKFLHAGVNINSQNKMNGWTCLHWAVHRNHIKIVDLLLSYGADKSIKNKEAKTAEFYVKSSQVAELFGTLQVVKNDKENEFVPNYILYPEFLPELSVPTDAMPSKVETASLLQTIFVYADKVEEGNLKGSVKIDINQSISGLCDVINNEIDDVPVNFSIQRYDVSMKMALPVNKKQYTKAVKDLFNENDSVIIKHVI